MKQDNNKELLRSLKELDHQMGQLKRYSEFLNRKSMVPSSEELSKDRSRYNKLSINVEELVYSMTDNGWYYSAGTRVDLYSEITFEKEYPRSDASEELVQEICSEIDEVVSHFEDRKFNCHYRMAFNNKRQFENNPKTHRNDLYTFRGIGENATTLLFYPEERYEELSSGGWAKRMRSYDSSENFIAQITLFYI